MFRAIDIGGTQIKQADIDENGEISSSTEVETPKTKSAFLACLDKVIDSLPKECQGIGISCPGKIDTQTKTVYHGGSLEFLDQFSFADYFGEKNCEIPLAVQNDGKAAVLGEYWLGNLEGTQIGIALTLGTGVGGGIMIDGKVLEGKNFQAGEFSFLLNRAAWPAKETMIGADLSAARFIKRAAKILELTDTTDGKKVFNALSTSANPELLELFEEYCFKIAALLLNLQIMFDPEKIVIGGGISAQAKLLEEINHQYTQLLQHNPFYQQSLEPVKIETCRFQNRANLLGAIYPLRTELSYK